MGQRGMASRLVVLALVGVLLWSPPGRTADHEDSPSVRNDPTTDLGDVLAWMSSDAQRMHLVATVVRRATSQSRFSDAARYVLHTQSGPAVGAAGFREVDIVCTFDGAAQQIVTCDADGVTSVTGNANVPGGITSADGRLRVFAGLRNDAFFFNADGFNAVRSAVIDAAPSLSFDPAGCPNVDSATASALQQQLRSNASGGPASDAFANANILVLAIAVDKSILTRGGPIVAVWGSTNRR